MGFFKGEVVNLPLTSSLRFFQESLHPGRLTWNLQITHLERKMIFQTSMIMFHVNLPGCRLPQSPPHSPAGHLELLRLQALLQQGEGCAAFGNAAFLEAAVEVSAPLVRCGHCFVGWFGVSVSQLAKTPSPTKKG